ncbi:MAG TPA: DinB family protein [Vicinamibacterales bacterium]|nr:DinB family protein [Vicinamibacterales bacterium]
MQTNPYAADLGDRDPFRALEETPQQIRRLVEHWRSEQFERSYAPGKWSARKILIHLAQTELALGARVRFALTQDNYAAQSFAQDYWLPLDDAADARTALDAYTTLRRLNLALWRKLTPEQKNRTFSHPEYGQLTVGWVATQMAGHDLHHLKHFEQIS